MKTKIKPIQWALLLLSIITFATPTFAFDLVPVNRIMGNFQGATVSAELYALSARPYVRETTPIVAHVTWSDTNG